MKIERFVIPACCGRKQIVFKIDRPVQQDLINILKSNGFTEAEQYTKVGLLYMHNSDIIVSAPIGADRINVKCNKDDCEKILNDFEALLLKMG
jgi:hypothetical protein